VPHPAPRGLAIGPVDRVVVSTSSPVRVRPREEGPRGRFACARNAGRVVGVPLVGRWSGVPRALGVGGHCSGDRAGQRTRPGPDYDPGIRDAPGVVVRSEGDGGLAVVGMRPGGMSPAGQRHRDERVMSLSRIPDRLEQAFDTLLWWGPGTTQTRAGRSRRRCSSARSCLASTWPPSVVRPPTSSPTSAPTAPGSGA
jgi:hypothetical protein